MSDKKDVLVGAIDRVIALREKIMIGSDYRFNITVLNINGKEDTSTEYLQKNLNNLLAHRDKIVTEFNECPPLHYERIFAIVNAFENCNENIKKLLGL
jgi:hypothetical protein